MQTNRHTYTQTDTDECYTPVTLVGMSNNMSRVITSNQHTSDTTLLDWSRWLGSSDVLLASSFFSPSVTPASWHSCH